MTDPIGDHVERTIQTLTETIGKRPEYAVTPGAFRSDLLLADIFQAIREQTAKLERIRDHATGRTNPDEREAPDADPVGVYINPRHWLPRDRDPIDAIADRYKAAAASPGDSHEPSPSYAFAAEAKGGTVPITATPAQIVALEADQRRRYETPHQRAYCCHGSAGAQHAAVTFVPMPNGWVCPHCSRTEPYAPWEFDGIKAARPIAEEIAEARQQHDDARKTGAARSGQEAQLPAGAVPMQRQKLGADMQASNAGADLREAQLAQELANARNDIENLILTHRQTKDLLDLTRNKLKAGLHVGATVIGLHTIKALLRGEQVDHGSITLIPASDIANERHEVRLVDGGSI